MPNNLVIVHLHNYVQKRLTTNMHVSFELDLENNKYKIKP